MSLFEPIFEALNAAQARYVVVGGFATVLHGYARLTADLDMVVDLDPGAATKTLGALDSIGLRPRAPVPILSFADPAARLSWIRDKGMRVFSLWDPAVPMREVDLFVETPIPFDDLWSRSDVVTLARTSIRIAGIPDLIALKRIAGRPQDLQDIAALERITDEKGSKAGQ